MIFYLEKPLFLKISKVSKNSANILVCKVSIKYPNQKKFDNN